MGNNHSGYDACSFLRIYLRFPSTNYFLACSSVLKDYLVLNAVVRLWAKLSLLQV